MSSGSHQVFRLSRRGNRRLNHAIHLAAVTQLRHTHSPGRGYYDRKVCAGKSKKMALRALKRRISDVIYRHLLADADRLGLRAREDRWERLQNQRDLLDIPVGRLFGEVTPGPIDTLRQPADVGSTGRAETATEIGP